MSTDKTEDGLDGHKDHFEVALDAARMGAWDSNFLTGELTWSSTVESLFGLEPGSFKGTREALYELIYPEDRELVGAALDKAIAEGVDFVVEHRVVWPDGSLHWLAKHGRVIKDANNNPLRLVGVVRDITRRINAQAQQEALLQINGAVQEMTRSTHLEAVLHMLYVQLQRLNVAFVGLAVHWVKVEETKTIVSYIILPSGEVQRMVRQVSGIYNTWKSGQVSYRRDLAQDPGELAQGQEGLSKRYGVPIRCVLDIPHGRGTFALLSDQVEAFSEGQILFFERVADVLSVGIARLEDLERLEEQNLELQEASRAKSEFLARMSHEIRTPMNGVIGMAELLGNTQLTTQQRDYLNIATNSADSLLLLINDILDFSKIEAGKLDLEIVPFSLRDILGDTLQTMSVRASEQGLELTCHIPPEVPDGLVGDPGRLRQIMVNLVGNAIKFTEAGEVTVRVSVEMLSEYECCLKFAVQDTGIGIPKESQARIFDAFSQADTSTTREYGGTGLGLGIAAQLAEMMGGQMSLDSEIGEGTTFYFTIKLGLQGEDEVKLSVDLSALENLRVLVVDDNQTNRQILAEMLNNWGLLARVVSDGFAALAELERAAVSGRAYGLAILDVMMPKMDGFELAHRIRKSHVLSDLQLLVLSSAGHSDARERMESLGIHNCLIKPVKQSNLLNAIIDVFGYGKVNVPPENSMSVVERMPPQRILLAEDGLVNQMVATDMLTQHGHSVSVVANGREALDALNREPFDLILMDVQMPEMDGLEATREIRRREQGTGDHILIIAMTAGVMKGDREACSEAGMDGYVAKPIKSADLFDAIRSVSGDSSEVK